jgi:hypothetical protein
VSNGVKSWIFTYSNKYGTPKDAIRTKSDKIWHLLSGHKWLGVPHLYSGVLIRVRKNDRVLKILLDSQKYSNKTGKRTGLVILYRIKLLPAIAVGRNSDTETDYMMVLSGDRMRGSLVSEILSA